MATSIISGSYLPVTILPRLSTNLSKLVEQARQQAQLSTMPMRHGAVMFAHSGKQVFTSSPNTHGHKICGYDVPGQHAEANCLNPSFRQTVARRRRYQAPTARAKVWREKLSCFLRDQA